MIKLFESFREIEDICRKYDIQNYTINSDGSIDVADEEIVITFQKLTQLPLKFNQVIEFSCDDNQLTSLEGAPRKARMFSCTHNKLTSLEGCPEEVSNSFYCGNNYLTSLENGPKKVKYSYYCHGNQLTSLQGMPQDILGDLCCSYNQLTSLEGAPRKVNGNFECNNNKIYTFDGTPDYVGGNFWCEHNPIYEIWMLFQDYKKMEFFNDCDPIREVDGKPAIIIDRLNDFLEEIGKPKVKKVNGYINI